jgi:hypothetical protein
MGSGSTLTSKLLHNSGAEASECSASGPKRGCGSGPGYLRTGAATGDKLSVVSTVNAKAVLRRPYRVPICEKLGERPCIRGEPSPFVVTVAGFCSRFVGDLAAPKLHNDITVPRTASACTFTACLDSDFVTIFVIYYVSSFLSPFDPFFLVFLWRLSGFCVDRCLTK